jgi:hypothetical protein
MLGCVRLEQVFQLTVANWSVCESRCCLRSMKSLAGQIQQVDCAL